MPKKEKSKERVSNVTEDIEGMLLPRRIPRWPIFMLVSGLYSWRPFMAKPIPYPIKPKTSTFSMPEMSMEPSPELNTEHMSQPSFESESELSFPLWFNREELRLDVDGRYPQMIASGTVYRGLTMRVNWIANLTASGANQWGGHICYKDGNISAFPYTNVFINATRSWYPNHRNATVTFSGGGLPNRILRYSFKSQYLRDVEFEFDRVEGTDPVTDLNTCDHPNRPASLSCDTLSIKTVFKSAGFDVKSGDETMIPLSGAGPNATWSDMEMHDAMQTYWARFANKSQWSMWVLFAALHDQGPGLGGIMFDDIGPNHRQGTAIFNNSFISNPPPGDPNPDAWVKRMRFWTACHEMGHCFNLAHSWQKTHPPEWGTPWIPLSNENEARSFMNYPYNVSGGQSAFFSDFDYRFSDSELLFMRHAPERFVQMGNADWFDHHGFKQAEVFTESKFRLELRVNRAKPIFEFLEPVVLELKLTNMSPEVQLFDGDILSASDKMTIILKKQGKAARQWVPFAQYCCESKKVVLAPCRSVKEPGGSIYESLFVSAGQNGWDLAEPGNYSVQVALHMADEDIVSNPLKMRIAPPQSYDEKFIAQDFFSEDVGRILTFDGSQFLKAGNDTLHEVVSKLGKLRVALHARIALANPLTYDYKTLLMPEGMREMTAACEDEAKFKVSSAKMDAARKELNSALMTKSMEAAETLGNIDFKYYMDEFSKWLDKTGDADTAVKCQDSLYKTLSARKASLSVLDDIKRAHKSYMLKKEKIVPERKKKPGEVRPPA